MTNSPEIARARQVFRFLKAFAERGVPSRRRLADQLWTLRVYELPDHPVVSVGEVRLGTGSDAVELESESQSEPLLRVGRPRTTMAPEPPAILNDFLKRGWEDPTSTIEVIPARSVTQGEQTITERFDASPPRVNALAEWQTRWNAWAATERPARQAMRVFERLYDLHGRIEREGEDVELMLGDGRLRWRHAEGPIDHPILLQRVELVFDASVPEFRVLDADRGPELYEALIGSGETISAAQLNQLRVELEQAGYHPLERTATSGFLRRLVRFLGPHGVFRDRPSETPPGPDPHVTRDPVFFLRTRNAGYPAAFDRVLSDLDTRSALPIALTRLVGVEPPPDLDLTHQASSPWGEPHDVLLSKPANPEQIQIARALERYRAVLVQGPPGTGKSHTIANLIGHLVAQGKRVLVTSHTTKALRVLREQIVEPLRPLCVAVLDNDLEGRKQMEQAVRGILTRLTESSEEQLEREAALLARQRESLLAQMDAVTAELRAAREAEYLPVIVGGEPIDPAEAARWLKDKAQGNDWIPGPIQQASPLPLAEAELRELYAMNGRLSAEEETEISDGLPETEVLPAPAWFAELVGALHATETPEQAAFWDESPSLDHEPALAPLVGLVRTAAEELARMEPWQRAVVAAGHTGGSEHSLWMELAEIVRDAARGWDHARPMLLEHEVTVHEEMTSGEWHGAVTEITQHLAGGGSLNSLTLLVNPRWKKVIRSARINGREPSVQLHFNAATEFIALRETRQRLAWRWARQAEPIGLPRFGEFGAAPEPIAQQYAMQFEGLLTWWKSRWAEIEPAMTAAGFRWTDFRAREIARAAPAAPFEQDSAILSGPLQAALTTRLGIVRRARAGRTLEALDNELSHFEGPVCAALRNAVRERDPQAYEAVFAGLKSLVDRRAMWQQRNLLLKAMQATAPGWSEALRKRAGVHSASELPGDVALAWRWRQLRQEIDRRASLDERALMRQLHQLRDALRTLTGQVIDRRAWLSQLQRTDLVARQALQGWADTQKKIGKGTGQRVPALQAEARRLLTEARDAVPVWIMPLSRVADSFDATRGRFDVVIIDEASQSDVTGLLAWYLGDRIAVVGDHEQVSPMAVGQQIGAMQALIAQHLDGVPNNHLYDGTTSVYDLARQCFGGTIALREHFRCVPDIIEFSNELSYNNEIRPLRDASNVPRPHVIEYMVDADLGSERTGKTNLAEARVIVSLMKALTEMPEYSRRTMSAITLLGDEQAELIQELALRLLGAVELERRRFVAGNSAQFQGDERDVIFLSLVDTPIGGALPLRETESFKQRYNVAVSRAKDQLWLIHSLDPAHDLKAGDLRRRLIEYVRDPGAKRRAMQRAERRVESPLETAVSRRLVAAGYRVQTQVWIGRYRIDMMVSDDQGHVAIECDGERYHGMEDISVDMARQAVLERAGWRFIRVRSTRFYSDPDGTMEWLFEQLHALGIERSGSATHHSGGDAQVAAFRESVLRRAMEIMRDQQWLPPEPEHTPLPLPPPVVAGRREKRKNGGAH